MIGFVLHGLLGMLIGSVCSFVVVFVKHHRDGTWHWVNDHGESRRPIEIDWDNLDTFEGDNGTGRG